MADAPTEQQERNLNIQATDRGILTEDTSIRLSPEGYDELVKHLGEKTREVPQLQEQVLKATAFRGTNLDGC